MKHWVLLAVMLPGVCCAQELDLPSSQSPAPPAAPGCTSVTAGSAVSYGCIDEHEKALVAQQKAGQDAAGLSPNTAPPKLGLYNRAGVQEQFGNTFGKSTIPQRPPPAIYTSPLAPHR